MNKLDILENQITPIGDNEIHKYFPKEKIFSYSQLADKSLHDLLPDARDSCFILYESSKNNGHWVCLCRYLDGQQPIIEFCDSYGGAPDSQLKWTPKETRNGLGITRPFLSDILSEAKDQGMKVIHNTTNFQSKNPAVATCGRHCCVRVKMLADKRLTLEEYQKVIADIKKKTGMNYDEIVSSLIN
jgi:hypothetical protein